VIFSASFSDSSAAKDAPFAVSRVNQNSINQDSINQDSINQDSIDEDNINQDNWEQAFVAAGKVESLPSNVAPPYSVRNRTSITQSRSIVAVSK